MLAATIRRVVSWQAARAPSSTSPEQGTSPLPPTAGCAPDLHETAGADSGTTAQCSGSSRSLGPLRTRSRIWAACGSRLYRSRIGACSARTSRLALATDIFPLLLSANDGTLVTPVRLKLVSRKRAGVAAGIALAGIVLFAATRLVHPAIGPSIAAVSADRLAVSGTVVLTAFPWDRPEISQPDVEAGETANGFFHADMRHLSNWQLLVDGRPVHVLTSRTVDYYSASVFGTLASVSVGENPPISIRRDRFIASGVHEDVTVQNHSGRPQTVMIEVQYRADFADLFEVKDRKPKRGQLRTELGENAATLIYSRDAFRRDTVVGFSEE